MYSDLNYSRCLTLSSICSLVVTSLCTCECTWGFTTSFCTMKRKSLGRRVVPHERPADWLVHASYLKTVADLIGTRVGTMILFSQRATLATLRLRQQTCGINRGKRLQGRIQQHYRCFSKAVYSVNLGPPHWQLITEIVTVPISATKLRSAHFWITTDRRQD